MEDGRSMAMPESGLDRVPSHEPGPADEEECHGI